MIRPGELRERLIVLFALGLLAFNYPILSLFNVGQQVWGVPVLFVYVFVIWLALILLLLIVMRSVPRRRSGRHQSGG